MIVTCPVIMDKIQTLKDGSFKLTLQTSELEDNIVLELMKMRNQQVYCGFKEIEVKADELDIAEMPVEFKKDKSQSERIRSVLFVYWDKHKPTTEFKTFYNRKTDEFIEMIKDKI